MLTRTEIAEKHGVSLSFVGSIAAERVGCPRRMLYDMARLAECTPVVYLARQMLRTKRLDTSDCSMEQAEQIAAIVLGEVNEFTL